MGRLHGSDASLAMKQYRRTSALKAMDDRTPTSGRNGTRVGSYIRNGSHGSCVGMDQDDFGGVERVSFGELEMMDNGMEWNDGLKMDQEWNQPVEMLKRVELSDFVVKPSLNRQTADRGQIWPQQV